MTQPRIESASGVGGLASRWDLLADSLYSSSGWLAASEGPGLTRRYSVLIRSATGGGAGVDDESAGAATALAVATRFDDYDGWAFSDPIGLLLGLPGAPEQSFAPEAARRLADLRAGLTPQDLYPVTVCGLGGGYLPGIVTAPGAQAGDVADALTQVERQAADWGTSSTAVMFVPERDTLLRQVLTDRGYIAYTPLAECALSVAGWSCFDDYIAHLPSARRNNVRREIAAFARSGAWFTEASVHELGPAHADLHIEHLHRYGHDAPADGVLALFDRLRGLFPGARVIELRSGNDLLGFLLLHDFRGWLYPKLLGLTTAARRPPYAYFNLGYYETIRFALRNGRAGIVFGPEAYEVKALRGLSCEPRTIFLRPPEPLRDQVAAVAAALDGAHRLRYGAHPWRH